MTYLLELAGVKLALQLTHGEAEPVVIQEEQVRELCVLIQSVDAFMWISNGIK